MEINRLSRRTLLSGSAALLAASALSPRSARAEPTFETYTDVKPAADLSAGGRVTQIIMVVKDVDRVARRFSDVFGPSWSFYEFRPRLLVLHDKPVAQPDCLLKLAVGHCGGHVFKLIQPVSGPGPYAEFLQAQGEGFYGISVGAFANYDAMADALKSAGAATELQADVGDGCRFSVLETVNELGLRVEFANFGTGVIPPALKATGSYVPKKPALVDMDNPVLEGGKKFTQLGIVVKDGHRDAHRWAERFGIRNWRFQSLPATYYAMFGREYSAAELPSVICEQCVAYLGDTQIELLVPVPEGPGGIHRRFFDRHGSGFQHLMLTPRTPSDHDATLAALWRAGMTKEIEYHLSTNPSPALGHYTGMEEQVGGFVLEY
jgi:hypothetical protein